MVTARHAGVSHVIMPIAGDGVDPRRPPVQPVPSHVQHPGAADAATSRRAGGYASPMTADGLRPSACRTARAALRPGRPETEPPGWDVDPVRNSPGTDVA